MNKKKTNRVIIIVFLGALYGLTVMGFLKPEQQFSDYENRYLQTRPQFSAKSFFDGSFAKDYEAYISDQFIGRNEWIALKTGLELARGMKDTGGVYFGSDDYFFQKSDAGLFTGQQARLNMDVLPVFFEGIKHMENIQSARVLLVPTASCILKAQLPAFAPVYDQRQLLDDLKETMPEETVIDVTDLLSQNALESQENEKQIFYRTDHHWTTYGAYLAYTMWAQSLGFEPVPERDFDRQTVTSDFLGTLNSRVNVPMQPDSIELWTYPALWKVFVNEESQARDGFYDLDKLATKDQYAVFFGGNYGTVKIEQQACESDRRLLVIKDSYANSFVPFAALHFEKTYMLDLRYANVNMTDFIREHQITDILVLYSTENFVQDRNIYKMRLNMVQ